MIAKDQTKCPDCGCDKLVHYDTVNRVVRTKGRKSANVRIRRMRCKGCKKLHRELPSFIFPYKQYESEIINGVKEGLITPETYGFEDYPCEATMLTWVSHILHPI